MNDIMSKDIMQCLADMRHTAETGEISLDAQIRVYDLLENVVQLKESGSEVIAEEFCLEYDLCSTALETAYDEQVLLAEAQSRLFSYRQAYQEACERAQRAVALHECAKETYEIWQNKGFVKRYKYLRRLRSMAGFRLESDRIGNYVAKTFDLMNEAAASCARAQQAMFAADVSYKVKPGLYSHLASVVRNGGMV